MKLEILKNINQIIERESKDATYKFALLRATIEVIQEKSPYTRFRGDRVELPTGLLILKWLEYYYPFVKLKLAQRNGDKISTNTLAFRQYYEKVTEHYSKNGGYVRFYLDLIDGIIPTELQNDVFELCKSLRNTIIKQPMKYLGTSVYKDYNQIFVPLPLNKAIKMPTQIDSDFIGTHFGFFSIPKTYYDAFEMLGSFITGTHSIIFYWAKFTEQLQNNSIGLDKAIETLIKPPFDERDTNMSRTIFINYRESFKKLHCVWTGKAITDDLNIDHMLPFSVLRNNDLWNLMPAKKKINGKKDDKIPSPELLAKSKDRIINYWNHIREIQNVRFEREAGLRLVQKDLFKTTNWENAAFQSFQDKCDYLIKIRGYEPFNI